MKIISACLAGVKCRYDGNDRGSDVFRRMVARGEAIPVCPEQLGGLPTPRSPAQIRGGSGEDVLAGKARLVDHDGVDRTDQFTRGAREALRIALLAGADEAIFKERSPSCGCRFLVRDGEPVSGKGVTTALLESWGIRVVSDEEVRT